MEMGMLASMLFFLMCACCSAMACKGLLRAHATLGDSVCKASGRYLLNLICFLLVLNLFAMFPILPLIFVFIVTGVLSLQGRKYWCPCVDPTVQTAAVVEVENGDAGHVKCEATRVDTKYPGEMDMKNVVFVGVPTSEV